MALQPGQVLNNRYRVVGPLGQGGFGAVYRVWDLRLQKPCALKENFSNAPDAQTQFFTEAKLLANLKHPNLPRVTDYFVNQAEQYLVMDFVEGETLEDVCQRQGRVPPTQAVAWIAQIADVLTYLHSQTPPVIHRDIKPANIRITPTGEAMLVDFGIAKEYDPVSRTTRAARAVTPGYSPPEQYGFGNTDHRADLYALAATLYHLLTGQNLPESVYRVTGDTLALSHQLNPAVSPALSFAVQRGLSLDPNRRFQTAAQFKAELLNPSQPLQPSNPTLGWLPLTAIIVVLACVLLVGLGAVAAVIGSGALQATNAPPPTALPTAPVSTERPIPSPSRPPDTAAPEATRPATELAQPTDTFAPPPTPTLQPAGNPTRGLIALRSSRSGYYEVAVMNADGSGFRQLTANQNISDEPDFSPDGQQIVFERKYGSGSDWRLQIISVNGGSETSLGAGRQPAWSPDGDWIAFEDADGSNVLQIWRIRINGSGREQLTFNSYNSRAPNWSPDGRQLVYMAHINCVWQVVILDLTTFQQRQVTTDSSDKRFPVWSPDGQWIAYNTRDTSSCSSTASCNPDDIWIVDINGNNARPVTTSGGNGRPGWSPDGQYIAFNVEVGSLWKIARIAKDGSGYTVLSNDGNDEQPDWSP